MIFVQVALTRGMSGSVQPLIDPDAPLQDVRHTDTAVFFSISNCRKGLQGVPFGNSLIDQVMHLLRAELPAIRNFCTLSPVPRFAEWLAAKPEHTDLHRALEKPRECGPADREAALGLCARYLLFGRRRDEPVDPVARFHLRNGAWLERINWLADTSETGLQRSYGIMVNYVYFAGEIDKSFESVTFRDRDFRNKCQEAVK